MYLPLKSAPLHQVLPSYTQKDLLILSFTLLLLKHVFDLLHALRSTKASRYEEY